MGAKGKGHVNTVAMYCCLHHPNYIILKLSQRSMMAAKELRGLILHEMNLMQVLHNMAQVPSTKMEVLELIQRQVQIMNWIQLKVVL
jgi:hypothetical protein